MSLLSSLFGKKDAPKKEQVAVEVSATKKDASKTPSLHLKGKPDAVGLYPSELVMLSLAEQYIMVPLSRPLSQILSRTRYFQF